MPRKASAAAGPRRTTPRTTACKSSPRVAATKSAARSKPNASAEATPPSAATTATATAAASVEPVSSISSPTIAVTPAPKTTPKPAAEVPASTTPETTPSTSLATKSASKKKSESALSESFSEKINETNPKTSEESRNQIAQNETLDEKVPESAAIVTAVPDNAGGSGLESGCKHSETKKGMRTVLKKTVRVVKRVVKKRVPKLVPKCQAVSSSEESGKVRMVDGETENPSPVLGELGVENSDCLQSDSSEVENVKSEPIASVLMEIKNPNSDIAGWMEATNPNPNPNPSASEPMSIENYNSSINCSIQVENPQEPEVMAGKEKDSMNEKLYASPVPDVVDANNTRSDGEMAVSTTETFLEEQNVGRGGSHNEKLVSGNVDSGGGEGGAEKEEVGKFDVGDMKGEVGSAGELVWSGEMEALERRKRRKTEIFVGGLDKDAKEEDIRKAFREVGEIVDVRLLMNDQTAKNKGFAFVRYASAADAKKALKTLASVEICGKQCRAVPAEGNDTIFLGNIDRKWKSEDIVKLLQEIGVEKIDKVTVKADPSNIECNRGFAFLELETIRDAQNAYRKLQKKDVFGKHQKIKVAWAEPLSEPDEEEMLKVKSVYAEYLPSSWDEEKVKDYFIKFGEIENVTLARDLLSSRRKDFAFVNYTNREAALACIEAFSRESLNDEGSKVNVKVSLAKPLLKGKQVNHITNPISKETPKAKMKAAQPVTKPHQPRNKEKNASGNYENVGIDRRSSTTAELVQLLRQQASMTQPQTGLGTGSADPYYPYSSSARKRPLSLLGVDSIYSDPRGYPCARIQSSLPAPSSSGLSRGAGATSLPYNHQQGAGYASGSLHRAEHYPTSLQSLSFMQVPDQSDLNFVSQTRGVAPYYGSSATYRRY